jgi:hypothetical protein
MLFNGRAYAFGGGNIYGYTTHPNINTHTQTVAWDSSASGSDIVTDVVQMKAALTADGHYGPYALYIPQNYEYRLGDDYKTESDKSLRMRLLEIDGLNTIRVSTKLTDDYVVMVSLTSDVIRLVQPVNLQTVQWDTEGGPGTRFKVMTVSIPQVRADQSGKCGVCLSTT